MKLSRNFEILDFLREQILSNNIGESPMTINFGGEATLAVPNVIFLCLGISCYAYERFRKCVLHPTKSHILRLCRGYLPGT